MSQKSESRNADGFVCRGRVNSFMLIKNTVIFPLKFFADINLAGFEIYL